MIQSWKDVTLGLFMEISKINRSQLSEDEKVYHITALLAGMDYDAFMDLPLQQSRELVSHTHFMYVEPKPGKTRKTYKVGTRAYRMMRNMDDMTTAQYLNYQSISKMGVEEMLPDLMSIVLIPEGKTYGDYDMTEITEELRDNLNIEDALSVANFFIKRFEKSIRKLMFFSDTVLRAMGWKVKWAARKDKEKAAAAMIALRTVKEELHSMYGLLLSKPSVN